MPINKPYKAIQLFQFYSLNRVNFLNLSYFFKVFMTKDAISAAPTSLPGSSPTRPPEAEGPSSRELRERSWTWAFQVIQPHKLKRPFKLRKTVMLALIEATFIYYVYRAVFEWTWRMFVNCCVSWVLHKKSISYYQQGRISVGKSTPLAIFMFFYVF